MKRNKLIKELIAAGCTLERHGKKHDIYYNSKNGKRQPIPRHTEIQDKLVKHIKKYLGVN